jgi:hypothetical protein
MGRIAQAQQAPRVLVYDVETRPSVSMHWQHRGDMYIGPDQMFDPGGVMAWSAQWLGSKRVLYASDHHDGHEPMIRDLHALLESADVVIGFNHERFDNPMVATEMDALGLPRLMPVPQIDLLKVVRSNFRLPHNTLKYVADRFGLSDKLTNDGWRLWRKCVTDADGYPYLGPVPEGGGCVKAWGEMRRYAKRDTQVTTELYWYLRNGGWIKKQPHVGLFGGALGGCPVCGSSDRVAVKDAKTPTSSYPGYRCGNCNNVYRLTTRTGPTTLTRAV